MNNLSHRTYLHMIVRMKSGLAIYRMPHSSNKLLVVQPDHTAYTQYGAWEEVLEKAR